MAFMDKSCINVNFCILIVKLLLFFIINKLCVCVLFKLIVIISGEHENALKIVLIKNK